MKNGAGYRIAFYAPMKSPRHPVPSGDREMARNLITRLEATGAAVSLCSELRIFDKTGSARTQETLRAKAQAEIDRILTELSNRPQETRPQLWLTYHNYYKAPDLIGPVIAKRLAIPYVQVESTRARKRLTGPWSGFAEAAHQAADAADAIFYLTEQDHETLQRDRARQQRLIHLAPFLPYDHLPKQSDLTGPMLAVGMMRAGDKLASYALLAEALTTLQEDWSLQIVGDGPARSEVEALMAKFGPRVQFLGQLDRDALQHVYESASLFVWPGVNEAFGMVYLEAQSHGVPVLAQDRPGLRDVVAPWSDPDMMPKPDLGAAAYGAALRLALADPAKWRSQAERSRQRIAARHLAPAATETLWHTLTQLMEQTP